MAGVDVANSVLYELREPMEASFQEYTPLFEYLKKRGNVSAQKARYIEGGVAGGSTAQATGVFDGGETLDTTRTEQSHNWQIAPHRLVTAIALPKKEMILTSGRAAMVDLVKKYPELHIAGLAKDFERYFFSGVSWGISAQTAMLQGWNHLNGQRTTAARILGVGNGLFRFEAPASQTVAFQNLARSSSYYWYNGFAESTGSAELKKTLKKQQRVAARFAMPMKGGGAGPDIIFCDDDTYAIYEERQDSQVRLTKVQDQMDKGGNPAQTEFVINQASLVAAQNIILTDFTGAAASGVCMGLTTNDIEWSWYQSPTISDFEDRIANQDAVIAKYEMMGTLFFKRLTTQFVVSGTARA
jgi:hypothetical protein